MDLVGFFIEAFIIFSLALEEKILWPLEKIFSLH